MDFELVGVAMDAAHPERARELYEKAGITFVRAIDQDDGLWEALEFDVVPNGILIDEQGIVRYAKLGGFNGVEERETADVAEVERLLAAPPAPAAASDATGSGGVSKKEAASAREWFQRGVEALRAGDSTAAARHWRQALTLDPGNFVIRKQIWALEHPEQFYPTINLEWQREQMAKEKKESGAGKQ